MERAGPGAAAERRGRLQENLAAQGWPQGPSARAFLKDQTNLLNPLSEPVSRRAQVEKNQKDVLGEAAKGAPRDGKLGAKSPRHADCPARPMASKASQRAVAAHPEPPRKSTKPPAGLGPSKSRPAQPGGRLPAPSSGRLNPAGQRKPAEATVAAAAPPTGSRRPAPGARGSRNEGLQERLLSNKENVCAPASARPALSRVPRSAGSNLGNKSVLAPRQSSAAAPRTATGPKDGVHSRRAEEEPGREKVSKALPGSKGASQKPSVRPQPVQPPRVPTAAADLLPKNPGANQGKTKTARERVGKPLGAPAAGSLQPQGRPPQIRRSPAKPLGCSNPQGPPNPKPIWRPSGPGLWQKPAAKGEAGRKAAKVEPPAGAVPQTQPRGAPGARPRAMESGLKSGTDGVNPGRPKASGVQARRVPKPPTAADRKRQLEEWLASKGKTYKRPPMTLLQKTPAKLSSGNIKEEEEQEDLEQLLAEKINAILTECLELIEEGVRAEELSAVLSRLPQAEKFAKFWICKAKLLARSGPFDVTELYKAAVCAGAAPLEELRRVVLDMLKAANPAAGGRNAGGPGAGEPRTPGLSEWQHAAATPCPTASSFLPVSIKLQVTSASRGRELLEAPELKFLTPVRRSLRIERAGKLYPQMLKDHDPVVSSLREVLVAEEETRFLFRKNKALPEVAELEGLSLYPPGCC
ncbi:cytoskeleton-associated protein 2-like [Opisthocomus hoazin]|uniref:cytoskeleton-associated protein 2-like n=1 Tax=Opisthocomus hoazin TaxID=30419 RepID=UPI003F53DCF0